MLIQPFTDNNINTSSYKQGNVNILILQGKGRHTDLVATNTVLGSAPKSSGSLTFVFLTLSLFVDLFLFQCKPDQICQEQTLSAAVGGTVL